MMTCYLSKPGRVVKNDVKRLYMMNKAKELMPFILFIDFSDLLKKLIIIQKLKKLNRK